MYYEIENAVLKIGVETAGAQLKTVYSKRTDTEYLWQGDEAFWKGRAYNLFPIVGRAYENRYSFRGKTYEIRPHGLARDNEFVLIDRTATKLIFSLSYSEQTLKVYPCKFVFYVVYEICGENLNVTYRVENADESAIAFCLGGHPGFNVPFHPTGEFEDYYLEFPEKTAVEQCLLAPSKLLSGERTPFPLHANNRIPLTHGMFADDAVILAKTCRSVSLKRKRSRRFLTLNYPDFRYLGIWQTPSSSAPFICLEPWTALPAEEGKIYDLETKEDATLLPAGKTFEARWTLELHE
ncbi:MAG: aldose 1-epimerase family protein [Candidatus Scatosoma sp.]